MPYQNIDASLTPDEVQAIKATFQDVLTRMPFLVNLTAKERKSMLKTGPDSVSFVQNALSAAQDHPDILPSSFKVDHFQRDMELFTVLTELTTFAESVMSQIDDTRLALGSEAMRQSTQIYEYVKVIARKEYTGLRGHFVRIQGAITGA
uniref:Uncharacterized protein n=1 Tax=Candidatus Kentrum sp. FM TaxID=2126340 RepID=A0A450VYC0_9GAMM|nr:MAG: hypothetical protein BECKFM1743C_GA0114222_103581 [Candidatus Kentron sp. FM]VFJ66321.1 MAG: hypothetical protein BECKFM1743A_GA0114220_104087 [Candidatus Kentron sp. FM]VFK09752.1 MAG: hypothetical protein BECKFM1743B_GA0114221_101148 [Candidatus Kentron sp. FM]